MSMLIMRDDATECTCSDEIEEHLCDYDTELDEPEPDKCKCCPFCRYACWENT